MSAGVLAPFDARSISPVVSPFPAINLAVSVRAERRRLFQVLTVAEYMEAWLSIPGLSPGSRITVTSTPEHFRIDHFRSRELDFTITGLYRTCRRSKLHFTWRKDSRHGSCSSAVAICLRGDFGRTILALTHAPFGSIADRAWHRDLWEASLEKLCSLF